MVEFGWRKDPYDKRDLLHELVPVVPDETDLAPLLTKVRHQGSNLSCVGFGIGINLNSIAKRQGAYEDWHSPWWIYNGARFIEGTLAQNVAAFPRDALQWILENGCLLEQYWPYDPIRLDMTAPSSTSMAKANHYKDIIKTSLTFASQIPSRVSATQSPPSIL